MLTIFVLTIWISFPLLINYQIISDHEFDQCISKCKTSQTKCEISIAYNLTKISDDKMLVINKKTSPNIKYVVTQQLSRSFETMFYKMPFIKLSGKCYVYSDFSEPQLTFYGAFSVIMFLALKKND